MMDGNLDREESLVCEALVREIVQADRWMAIREAWQALLHVRQIAKGLRPTEQAASRAGSVSYMGKPIPLTGEQVERMLGDFKTFHDCEDSCNHDLNVLSVHDAAQRNITELEDQWRKTNAQYEAAAKVVTRQAQEIERLKDRNRNLMDVLRAIASMKLSEADRMQQWAKDGLSGFVEPVESTVLKLTDALAAMTTERDAAKEISDWFGGLVKRACIGTKKTPSLRAYIEQTEAKLAARNLSLEGSRAEVAALEQQLASMTAELAEAHAHLEAQRRETYASVEREQRLKRELEQAHGNYAIQKAAADEAETAAIIERADKLTAQAQVRELEARIAQLETEADAVAWKISPAMAQAKIDRLQATLVEREERIAELEGDFLIVTEQRLALTAERDAAVAEAGRLQQTERKL